MNKRLSRWGIGVAAAAAWMASSSILYAHDEHSEKSEAAVKPVTMEQLAEAITDYVNEDTALKGGFFLVYDPVSKAPLVLKLDHVHTERLSKVGDQLYFACADFKTPAGKIYDLDVFMEGPNQEDLRVTEIAVHKEAGVARYGWFEEKGIWKKKAAE